MATFVDAWRSAVLADAALKSRAKLLACALAEFATYTTGEGVWPSGETLAAMTSSSPRTVTLARQDLLSRGWIEAEKRAGAHGTIRQKLVMRTGVDAQNSRNEDSDNRLNRMEDSDNRESRSAESAGVDAQKTTSRSAESAHKHRKNTREEQEEEEEARTVRAKTRDAAATAAAPNSIARQVRTERDAERQEQQAPVESVRDADQAEGFEWEYTDYVDAIRQGHRDTGLMCHDMTHHHDRLVRLAMEEGWTPERLRQDVAANLGSYRKRNVNWHARMLVSDMGKRSAPSNLGAAMEVSHNNVVRQLGRAEVNAQRASNLWGMS